MRESELLQPFFRQVLIMKFSVKLKCLIVESHVSRVLDQNGIS